MKLFRTNKHQLSSKTSDLKQRLKLLKTEQEATEKENRKKAFNSSQKKISTSSDSKTDLEIANETVNSSASASASTSRKNKQSAEDKENTDDNNV